MIYQKNNVQDRRDFYTPKDPISALDACHQRAIQDYLSEKDKKEIVELAIQGVIERLSVTIDMEKAIREIEELKKALESALSILPKGGN